MTLVPGERPIAALAAALAPELSMGEAELARRMVEDPAFAARELRGRMGKDRGLVVFIDQLEELVTLSDPRAGGCGGAGARLARRAVRVAAPPGPGARGFPLGRVAALSSLGDAIAGALYILRPRRRLDPRGDCRGRRRRST